MIDTKALRSRVLDLAIQGKLTEQLESDGTAEELWQQIRAEKQRLIKEGKLKKEKPLPEILDDEIPFEIPENWKWVRLNEISTIINGDRGKNYPAKSTLKHEGIPFISALNLNGRDVTVDEKLLCLSDEQYDKLGNGKLEKDDLVICIRGSLGKHGRYQFEKGAIASSLVISRIYVEKETLGNYEMIWLDSSMFPNEIARYDSGTAQPNLAAENLSKFLVPFPPLAEQKRIVARVEEIFRLLDIIDAAQEQYAADAESLKAKLITLGIQGRLTEQLESDGTAEELYQQIQAEKQRLIKEGKIKREKPMPEISEDEIPFEIPENWKWVRAGNVFVIGTGVTPLKSEKKYYNEGNIPWVTSTLTTNRYISETQTYITEYALNTLNLKLYPVHTLIIAMYGEGKTRGQISELLIPATTNQACAALVSVIYNKETIDYMYYFFQYFYESLRALAHGGNQPNLNLQKIKEVCIPLPPLAEQKRIAETLERLLTILG